jgi:serine/threonine-protein kinase SRPK3
MSGCDELMGEKRQLLEERLEYSIQNQRRKEGMAEMSEGEKHDFLDLMRSMLAFRPEDRILAKEVLESAWMKKWANPVLESMESKTK